MFFGKGNFNTKRTNTMELSLDKKELKVLVELIMMSDWMLTAHDDEDDERKDEYIALIQKIYTSAFKNGMKKEIQHHDDIDEYYPEDTWEEETKANEFIKEYDEKTFFGELVEHFACRETIKEFSGKIEKDSDAQEEAFFEHVSRFSEEIEKNCLENIIWNLEPAKKAGKTTGKTMGKTIEKTTKKEKEKNSSSPTKKPVKK